MNQLATVEKNLFDYCTLSAEDQKWLREQEELIRSLNRRVVLESLTIGKLLNATREKIGRNPFKRWFNVTKGMPRGRTARRYMDAAKWFGEYFELIQEYQDSIDLCAIHELAEPSVHPDSRAAAMAYLAEKKELPRAAAAELIAKHTPAPVKNPALFANECDEPPPPPAIPDDRRFIESLQDLALKNGPVMLDGTADADDPDDVTYSISIGVKLHASGRTLPEALDRLTGHEKTKPCTMCGAVKPLTTGFTVKNGHADGYASECKTCSRARVNAAKKGQEAA